jgi:hypothetical protein
MTDWTPPADWGPRGSASTAPRMEPPALPLGVYLKKERGEVLTPDEETAISDYVTAYEKFEGDRSELGIVSLGDIMRDGSPEQEMLVPKVLAKASHHIIYGQKEASKTWLLLVAARRVMLDGGHVVWVDEEMGRNSFTSRLVSLHLDPELVDERFTYVEFPMLDLSGRRLALWRMMLEVHKPALVVVDAQTEVLATADLNENSGTDVAKWHMGYMAPAMALGTTTVVIDHTGHEAQGRARGSGHKGAQSKVELEVTLDKAFDRDTVGGMTVTRTKNTNAADIPARQSFKLGGDGAGGFVFEEDASPARKTRNDSAILEQKLLDKMATTEDVRASAGGDDPRLSGNALAGLVGGRKEKALEALSGLVEDGRVQTTRSGRSVLHWLADDQA